MGIEPGQILDGKYRVGRLIGEGGMGTVYEGENSRIGRRVAIKVLHAHVAAMPEFVERFEREARAAARIGSRHVCDVLDLGDLPSGDRYIVMEFLDGVSFEDRLAAKGKLTAAELAPIAFELLEGLGTMHNARVIHRDLKPANVFLARLASARGETVKILDFGVAKLQPFEGEIGTMTQTGMMMGTPLYMSPEQARGARDVDGRTDIYAASVMFYRALSGELPYAADTLNELLFKIVLEDPRPIRDLAPEVDEVFAGIVHKGLARDLEQRFQSAREYQEAIAGWGKTQGRSSLAFAVTMPSDPPGPASSPRDIPPMPAPLTPKGLTTGPNLGTPTAWSEDGPEPAKVRPAAGAPSGQFPNATVASAQSIGGRGAEAVSSSEVTAASHPEGPLTSAIASTLAVDSSLPSGAWNEGPPAAISAPGGGGAAANGKKAANPTTPRPAQLERRGLPKVAFAIGGASLLAAAAFFAFARGSTPAATGTGGLTATGATVAVTPLTSAAAAATERPTAADPLPTPAALPPNGKEVQAATAPAASDATPAPASRTGLGTGRKAASAGSSSAAAIAPPAAMSAPPPVASTPAPKPTGSAARKFRTNID